MSVLQMRRQSDLTRSYIISNFEAFYHQILLQKERVQSGAYMPISSSEDRVPGDLNADSSEGARYILEHLASLLEKQVTQIQQQGGDYASQYFREALYIMVSLADEVFLSLDWQGRKYWEDNLLESRFFNTHDAGDLFFNNLDAFLSQRDPAKKDLGEVYLMALGLGFLGKYRGVNDYGDIRRYLRQLYTFVHHRDLKLFEDPERLFPEAYMHTLEGEFDGKTSHEPLGFWTRKKIIIGSIVGMLVLSHVAWRIAIHDLADLTSKIRKEALL